MTAAHVSVAESRQAKQKLAVDFCLGIATDEYVSSRKPLAAVSPYLA